MDEISNELVQVAICEKLKDLGCIPESAKIQLNESFYRDLGVDSLDLVELVVSLEDSFGVTVKDDDIDCVYTNQDYASITVEYMIHLVMGRDPGDFWPVDSM